LNLIKKIIRLVVVMTAVDWWKTRKRVWRVRDRCEGVQVAQCGNVGNVVRQVRLGRVGADFFLHG
jgi:hypothetical protein